MAADSHKSRRGNTQAPLFKVCERQGRR